MKVVIIGGVAAGTKTAAKLKRMAADAQITLLAKDKDISYAGCGLPYYVGGSIEDRAELIVNTPAQYSALTGVELKDRLRADYHIEVEMALDHYAVAMTGLGNDDDMPSRLAQALLALDQESGPRQGEPLPPAEPYTLPPRKLGLEEAANG